MRQNASPEALEGTWKPGFPGQIPDKLVIAEELKGNVIDLEGDELVVVELGHTDTDHTTCLYVPSIGLVVAGDAAYNDVHLYLDALSANRGTVSITTINQTGDTSNYAFQWNTVFTKAQWSVGSSTRIGTEDVGDNRPIPFPKGIHVYADTNVQLAEFVRKTINR
jgi:hypothetical protein